MITWTSKISKGNGRGTTGLVYMPRNYRNEIDSETQFKVNFYPVDYPKIKIEICSNLKKIGGFYIPQKYIEQYMLIGGKCKITIKKSDYNEVKVIEEQSFRIPNNLVEKWEINKGNIVEFEINVGDQVIEEYSRVYSIERKKKHDEFYVNLYNPKLKKLEKIRFSIKKILSIPYDPTNLNNTVYIPDIFPEAQIGLIQTDKIIIFNGKASPIVTPLFVMILDFIHYMGCYLADGTKKGESWSINASTPEQAEYFLNKHSEIITNTEHSYDLSYTKRIDDNRSNDEIKKNLQKYWEEKTGIIIKWNRIKIRIAKSLKFNKWNKNGALRIRETRNSILQLYLYLLNSIKDYVLISDSKKEMWDFLFGILEGDGDLSGGKSRIGIRFSTTNEDDIILPLLNKLQIKVNIDSYKSHIGGKGISIAFGLIEILKNISMIEKDIFIFYPKRRMRFVSRLIKTSTIQYLLGHKENVTNYVTKITNENNIQNGNIVLALRRLEIELKKGF